MSKIDNAMRAEFEIFCDEVNASKKNFNGYYTSAGTRAALKVWRRAWESAERSITHAAAQRIAEEFNGH